MSVGSKFSEKLGEKMHLVNDGVSWSSNLLEAELTLLLGKAPFSSGSTTLWTCSREMLRVTCSSTPQTSPLSLTWLESL